MAECKHEFTGKSDGVSCMKCGITMTAEEYAEYVNKKNQPKRQPRKKVSTDE